MFMSIPGGIDKNLDAVEYFAGEQAVALIPSSQNQPPKPKTMQWSLIIILSCREVDVQEK